MSDSPSRRAERGSRRRWSALAGVVALAGLWGVSRGLEPASTESWVAIERRDLIIGVAIEGELRAVDTADLGPPQIQSIWTFKISFLAPEGAEVEEGDSVIGFDTTQLQQKLQEKMAQRDSAAKELEKRAADLEIERRDHRLKLAEAEASLRRAELKLGGSEQVTSAREVEKAKIDRRLARLEIDHLLANRVHLDARGQADLAALADRRDRAAVRVEDLETQIAAMTVKAPRSGTVIYKSNRGNDKKKVGDNAWRAEKVVEIPDLRRMKGKGKVAEADAGRVEVGQRVTLRLDAYPDHEYRARVSKIHRTVQKKSWRDPQKVVRLEIELEATDTQRMRPGMRFRGQVETARVADTLVIPQEAVFQQPAGSVVYVRTLFGRREVLPVFGERNAELFAVESGLEEGDRVLRRREATAL